MYVKKTPIISMSITDSISPNDTGINFRYPILSLKNADIKICINRHPKKKGFSFNYENPNDMLYAKFLDVKNDKIILMDMVYGEVYKVDPIFIYTSIINSFLNYFDLQTPVDVDYVSKRFIMNTVFVRNANVLFASNNKAIKFNGTARRLNVFNVRNKNFIELDPLYIKCLGYEEYVDSYPSSVILYFEKFVSTDKDTEEESIEILFDQIDDKTWIPSMKNDKIISNRFYIPSQEFYIKSIKQIAEKVSF